MDAAFAARDQGIERAENAGDQWDRSCIDKAIAETAKSGQPFSANDVRPLLGEVRRSLIGARFSAAQKRGDIRHCGYVRSTDPATHAHPVALWVKA